ncbi:Probable CtpA-like serine protease [Moraxella caviae]|nr:Probable CtpA-like serine protease [Moraxella caviae]
MAALQLKSMAKILRVAQLDKAMNKAASETMNKMTDFSAIKMTALSQSMAKPTTKPAQPITKSALMAAVMAGVLGANLLIHQPAAAKTPAQTVRFAQVSVPDLADGDMASKGANANSDTASGTANDANTADGAEGDTSGVSLEALESEPNVLHGIDGLHQGRVPLNAISPNTLRTFVAAVDLVRREYPDEISDDKLFYHAINGMLQKVDRHAEFLDAKAFENLQSFTSGHVAGVGLTATWSAADNHWVISDVVADSSAAKAGVTMGDYLHQIGDITLDGAQTSNDVVQLLNGIVGTTVDITFSKAGRSKRSATLDRTEEEQSNIEILTHGGIVIVKLPVFQNTTRDQILQGLAQLNAVQGIVIDVRNNPGGVLESAVDVASLFMRNQIVTQVAGRGKEAQILRTNRSPLLDEIPVIVLQNRYSASASEVLASSLQTAKRALVVGETSYGKGSVQSIIPIGDEQAIKLTTAHYLTPDGKQIDGVGVMPDVEFSALSNDSVGAPFASNIDSWLSQAINIMEQGKLDEGIEFAPVGGF